MPDTTVPLSVLDLSPIGSGRDGADALHDTIDLARAAERLRSYELIAQAYRLTGA